MGKQKKSNPKGLEEDNGFNIHSRKSNSKSHEKATQSVDKAIKKLKDKGLIADIQRLIPGVSGSQ